MRMLSAIHLTILAAVLGTACAGSAPKKYSGRVGSGTNSGGGASGDAVADEKAFELTLYPVVKQYCASCHGDFQAPVFASEDPVSSHKSIIDTAKIDRADPAKSRMYLKVFDDQHQCWSGDCVADGELILSKIEEWLAMANGGDFDPLGDIKFKTPELQLATATDVEPRDVDPASIVMQAETGTPTLFARTEVLSANGGAVFALAANAQANTARVSYTFNVTVPGDYRLLLKSNSTQANTVTSNTVNGTAGANITLATTGDGEFLWSAGTTMTTLPAGAATVVVTLATANRRPQFDVVALSSNPNFQGSDTLTGTKVKLLSYDISATCGVPGAKLEIEAADHQGQGYKFKNPVLTAPSPIKVKGIGIIVNGKPNAQYATFKLVDVTVPANSTEVLAGGAMIVLKDTDDDKYAFSFDECSGG